MPMKTFSDLRAFAAARGMFRRFPLLLLLSAGCGLWAAPVAEPQAETLTLRLTRAYDAAWDRDDAKAMYDMLDPECVFRSPFQTRLGRDAIRDNVFRNAKKFRDTVTSEETSKVDGDTAYSFATETFNEYDPAGVLKARHTAKHLFIFSRRPGEDWKIRFMIALEESHTAP
jgi:ketosteroid isomerase-like protein